MTGPAGEHKLPPDQAARDRIDTALDVSMLVEAAAGTGKTTKMVERMIALIRSGRCGVETLAAVTFTRKAASELRARFQQELERAVRESAGPGPEDSRLRQALEGVNRLLVGTIHSFCARLLRERPVEAGVDPGFRELDEELESELRRRAWNDYLSRLYAEGSPLLDRLAETGIPPSDLEEAFRVLCEYRDVREWPAPEDVPPGPETVLPELEAYIDHMRSLGPVLARIEGNDKLIPEYRLIPRLARGLEPGDTARLAGVMGRFRPRGKINKDWPGGKQQAEAEHERWKNFCEEVAEPFNSRWMAFCYSRALELLLPAAEHYDLLRAGSGRLSYQDLLLRARGLLVSRPGVRRYFARRITHLLVDEFQDTDPVQAEVMLLLTSTDPEENDWRRCVPRPGSLFVVGDPKQSIYRFRRADIVTYNQVRDIIVRSGGEVVRLSANFRSQPGLLAFANRVFGPRFEQSDYSPAYVPLESGLDLPAESPESRVSRLPTGDLRTAGEVLAYEPVFVARRIARLMESEPDASKHDFMVITYGRKHLDRYAAELERLGIPHQVTGSAALPAVEQLWLLHLVLSALTAPADPVALVALLRSRLFGFSDRELHEFVRAGGDFGRREVSQSLESGTAARFEAVFSRLAAYDTLLNRLPPMSALERIAADLGLLASAAAERGGNMAAGTFARALELLRSYTGGEWSLDGLSERLTRLAQGEIDCDSMPAFPERSPVVRVMNLHKAKGLEARHVFLACPEGMPPGGRPVEVHIDRSGNRNRGYLAVYKPSATGRRGALIACHPDWSGLEQEEQRFFEAERNRLYYVAVTRAAESLSISYKSRHAGNNPWKFFNEHLEDTPELDFPSPRQLPAGRRERADLEPSAEPDTAAPRWERSLRPSCALRQARELALPGEHIPVPPVAGEHGTERGSLVHRLLQAGMEHPDVGVSRLAPWVAREEDSDPALKDEAAGIAESVMSSALWKRALAAERCIPEAPFCLRRTVDSESGAAIEETVRGVIDLVFRESDGWVVVDYKTDSSAAHSLDTLVDKYSAQVRFYARCWSEATGERVKEAGLYFTAPGRYEKTSLDP